MPTMPRGMLVLMLLTLCLVASASRAEDPPEAPPVPPVIPPPADKPAAPVTVPSQDAGSILPEAPTWAGIRSGDRERRKIKNQSEQEWGFMTSEFIWRAPDPGFDSPYERGEWSTADLFAVPVSGPLHVFTELSLGGEYAADQAMKVVGKTGFLWKMSLGEGKPLEVRSGPTLKYNDALHSQKTPTQASVLWEVKAKAPLVGPIGAEYLCAPLPGTTPDERSQVTQ